MPLSRRRDGKLRALAADLVAGRPVERALAAVSRWPRPWFHAAIALLVEHGRAEAAEAMLHGRAHDRDDPRHAMQLVDVYLARGKIEEARATVATIVGLTPNGRELRTYLDAQVRIAEGDAAAVARRVALEPELGADAAWAHYRRLVRADAAAAHGDRDGARRLLADLPEPGRTRALRRLRASSRPAASIAAELLDGGAVPYR